MKSVRLSNSIREQILENVLSNWDEQNPEGNLEQAENDLAIYVWNKKFGKYKKHFDAIPQGFFQKRHYVKYEHGGIVNQAQSIHELPYRQYNEVLVTLELNDPIVCAYQEAKEHYQDWRRRRSEIKTEVSAILESVNTSKQLIELWPQVEDFLPAHVADPDKAIKLPALDVSYLNKRLGIKNEQR